MKNKVGILTCHYYPNFGSTIQAIALQNTIEKLGNKVNILNYHNPIHGGVGLKQYIKYYVLRPLIFTLNLRFFSKLLNNVDLYQFKHQKMTKPFCSKRGLAKISRKFDTIVCGSDQIWSPAHYFEVYFAPFINPNVRKISYAASLGVTTIPDKLKSEISYLLSSFDFVSVRESEAQKVLQKDCKIDSTLVLDPTLLLDTSDYEKLIEEVQDVKEPYVFCYFLNKEHHYNSKIIQEYANTEGLKIYGYTFNPNDSVWMKQFSNINAGNFIWLIKNATFVFTDSYHGTILSTIYHKNVNLFMRFSPDDEKCENSRIHQLNEYFGISNIVIDSDSKKIKVNGLDYASFENTRQDLKKQSLDYLSKTLQNAEIQYRYK